MTRDLEHLMRNLPNVDALMRTLDPADAERLERAREKQVAEAKVISRAWAEFAETEGGRRALDALLAMTLDRPIYFASLGNDPQQVVMFGAFREGQNAVATEILRQIKIGRGEEPPAPSGI